MSGRFRSASGVGLWWPQTARSCAQQLGRCAPDALGLLYVTEDLAPQLDGIAQMMRDTTGVDAWIGCAGAGIIGNGREHHGRGGISAMVLGIPRDAYHLLPTLRGPDDLPDAAPEEWIGEARPLVAIVHGDPRATETAELIGLLPEALDGYLVGGLTTMPGGHAQLGGDGPTSGGLSGAVLSAAVPVAVGLSQGCRPLGRPRVITRMDDDWVAALDGIPAAEALRRDLGLETLEALRDYGGEVHAAVPVEGSDTSDYLVRNLVALDPRTGRIGIASDLMEGERLMFVRRDAEAATEDLRAMVRRLKSRLRTPLRGALYVSCLARGPQMFGRAPGEIAILAEELGEEVPLTGFFASGEINNNRLYAYTGVLTLFPES